MLGETLEHWLEKERTLDHQTLELLQGTLEHGALELEGMSEHRTLKHEGALEHWKKNVGGLKGTLEHKIWSWEEPWGYLAQLPHFTEEKSEAQAGKGLGLRSYSISWPSPGFPRLPIP